MCTANVTFWSTFLTSFLHVHSTYQAMKYTTKLLATEFPVEAFSKPDLANTGPHSP